MPDLTAAELAAIEARIVRYTDALKALNENPALSEEYHRAKVAFEIEAVRDELRLLDALRTAYQDRDDARALVEGLAPAKPPLRYWAEADYWECVACEESSSWKSGVVHVDCAWDRARAALAAWAGEEVE